MGLQARSMMRWSLSAVALFLVLSACAGIADVDPTAPPTTSPQQQAATSQTQSEVPTSTVAPTASTESPATTMGRRPSWFLLWNSGVLVDGLPEAVAAVDGVEDLSLVRVGLSQLVRSFRADGSLIDAPPAGFVIPLETHVFDPASYGPFIPTDAAEALANLGPDDAAIGETSARLRRIDVGGTLFFDDGSTRTVTAIIADRWLGGAELALSTVAVPPGPVADRYLVFRYQGDSAILESQIDAGVPLRIRPETEARLMRHADVVLTQAEIKERFGEYSFDPGSGTEFTIDPAWVEANIIEVDLPLLGITKCHKDFAPIVAEAMEMIIAAGRSSLIDPGAFAGCWNARYIADKRGISRHSWGAAADINIFNDPDGPTSPSDPLLLQTFRDLGVTSGVDWLTPDPGHFEWYGPNPP